MSSKSVWVDIFDRFGGVRFKKSAPDKKNLVIWNILATLCRSRPEKGGPKGTPSATVYAARYHRNSYAGLPGQHTASVRGLQYAPHPPTDSFYAQTGHS